MMKFVIASIAILALQMLLQKQRLLMRFPYKIVGIIVGGIELPFNGCPVNACDNLSTGDCSVEEGEMLVYDMSIPILDVYPKIEITGKWLLKDDMGEDFLCFTIPMKIE